MFWKDKTVLVTGAGGFIGSHLVEELLLQEAKVRAFIHYSARSDWGNLELLDAQLLDKLQVFSGDLIDSKTVYEAVKGQDYIFHLGAVISVPHSFASPHIYIETNVKGTLNLLEACRQAPLSRLVHLSSSEVYGNPAVERISESEPLQAHSPYAASKIGADKMVESYFHAFSLPAVIARPFNNYGPRQSPRAIVPTIITQLLKGNRVKLGNLNAERDLLFVKDTVKGLLGLAESESTIGEVVNLGTGCSVSIKTLVETVAAMLSIKAEIETEEQRVRSLSSEVWRLCADTSKAKRLINWQSEVNLEEGLRLTLEWLSTRQLQPDRYIY
ncbi:MAG: GDP-mannose 4,6-dehydratase [Blastocatellia bacterium]|nr:GDP-mannose 4,6-dehydratase [Blastocatellia bacterium]